MAKVAQALETVSIRLPNGDARVFRYRATRADRGVVTQMFENEQYSFARLRRSGELVSLYEQMVAGGARPLILDFGAHIGAAAVYFSMHFPRAHIVSFEPDAANFEVLQANVAGLDVDARCAAIGSRDGEAALVDPGEGEWGYRTAEGKGVRVESAARLVSEKLAVGFAPFVAKIDIEGAEGELFSAETGWADRFPLVIIELHDFLLPRASTSQGFLAWSAARKRDFVPVGENVFSIAHEWVS